jgi:hypothetical protein
LEVNWTPGAFALTLHAAVQVESSELLCVVATFDGMRVGVWHNRLGRERAYQIFLAAEEAAKSDASTGAAYARLIRATKAPMLCEYSMPVVRSWIRYSNVDALVGLLVSVRDSVDMPFEEDPMQLSGWLDAVGLCYEGRDRRPCWTLTDEDACAIWQGLMPDVDPGRLKDRVADVFILVKKIASISPFLARDVISRYLTLSNTGIDYQQWKKDLRQVLAVSDDEYKKLGDVAGSQVDALFFSQNLKADATGAVAKRNQQVLFGLGERLSSNVPKQYYLSRIL